MIDSMPRQPPKENKRYKPRLNAFLANTCNTLFAGQENTIVQIACYASNSKEEKKMTHADHVAGVEKNGPPHALTVPSEDEGGVSTPLLLRNSLKPRRFCPVNSTLSSQ